MTVLQKPPRLLTTHQVPRRMHQSEESVRRKLRFGDLPGIRLGLGPRAPFRVLENELNEWLFGSPAPPDPGTAAQAPAERVETPEVQSSSTALAGNGGPA